MRHEGQYPRVHAWRPKELNPRAKAIGCIGSRPVISNAHGPEVITAADCADRKVRHSKGTLHAERGACVNRAWVCRCSWRPERHGRAFNSLRRQRSLGVAVIRQRLTFSRWRQAVVYCQRRLLLRGCNELAITNEVRVEYLCRNGIREYFGAFAGDMRDASYTVHESGNHENDCVFPQRKYLFMMLTSPVRERTTSLPETEQMAFLVTRRRSLSLSITP